MNHLIIYKWHWYYLKLIFKFIAKQETRVYSKSFQYTTDELRSEKNTKYNWTIFIFYCYTVINGNIPMKTILMRNLAAPAVRTDTMRFIINTVVILEFSLSQNTITASQTWWGLQNDMFNLSAEQRRGNDADVP